MPRQSGMGVLLLMIAIYVEYVNAYPSLTAINASIPLASTHFPPDIKRAPIAQKLPQIALVRKGFLCYSIIQMEN